MKLILFFTFCLMSMMVSSCQSESFQEEPNKYILLGKSLKRTKEVVKKKYNIPATGVTQGVNREGKYRDIGLYFQIKGPISKEKGIEIVLFAARELQKAIDENEAFRPYIETYPYPMNDLSITLIVSDQNNGWTIYHPDIAVFSLVRGTFYYRTNKPEVGGYFSSESIPLSELDFEK